MLRFFVFGAVGNEHATTPQERDAIFYEHIGTKDQVRQLFRIWTKLDDDDSGRVDVSELRAFAEHHLLTKGDKHASGEHATDKRGVEGRRAARVADPSLRSVESLQRTAEVIGHSDEDGAKFITKLCDKVAHVLLGKKSSFAIEDMMRVIWPCSELPQIKVMKGWCRDFHREAKTNRVNTPPVIDEVELDALRSVFEHFCEDGHHEINFDMLVKRGLIYEEQVDAYRAEWDKDGNGYLDLVEFCEMMCPVGYRAHEKSKVGSLESGQKIVYDDWMDGWRIVEHTEQIRDEEEDEAQDLE